MGILKNNTHSTIFSFINEIVKLMVKEIDNDNELKRYLTYLTAQPLEDRSSNVSGKIIYQRDIKDSITKPIKICVDKNETDKKNFIEYSTILYNMPYTFEKINTEYCTCFVYWNKCTTNVVSRQIFTIDVLVPSIYTELKPYKDNRGYLILDRLADLFDKTSLDEKSKKELGDLTFEIVGTPYAERITKSNDITLLSLNVGVDVLNVRGNKNGSVFRT